MIPATTAGGKFGPYAVVIIYVFSEPKWATYENLKRFEETSEYIPEEVKWGEEFGQHIRAHYWCHVLGDIKELGTLGYEEKLINTKIKTPVFEKLFEVKQ